MHLTFSPIRADLNYRFERKADTLIVNGEPYDFSALPEGATLPCDAVSGDWLASDVTRKDGILHLTLRLPLPASAPETARHPQSRTLTQDGPIPLPTGASA